MSTIEAPNMPQEQDIIDAHKSRQRKKRMSIAIGIFLLIGLLWALYWFFIARYHEETENAYVAGSMVVVNAQTAGTVEAILAEENQKQVEHFLSSHPDFQLVNCSDLLKSNKIALDTGEFLQLNPATHHTDGFFAAVMQKSSS